MRIAFVVNDVATEKENYTTPQLAFSVLKREHDVYLLGVGDLAYYSEGCMGGRAKKVPAKKFKSTKSMMEGVREAEYTKILDSDLDVIFLRNNPSDDMIERPWATNAALIFGQIAIKNGCIVVNDPRSLGNAMNKMYFQHFPEKIRPKTIITRNRKEIMDFYLSQKKKIVLKPLQGSGGTNVFLVDSKSEKNMNQMIDAINRDGFIIAQEYLPDASEGDIRLFVLNGHALCVDGKYAAMRRRNSSGDVRSNIHAGGQPERVKVDDNILDLVKVVRPKLLQDGMFLVGLDIVGDKLMEINVFSPGGLNILSEMEGANFSEEVIRKLEDKAYYNSIYDRSLDNKLASML
ncbi:glutathione synthetase [Roseivirga sp. BDSF3-8]|uniref:glutathione synthetase n=1 Tax=Roseivirga sp. BDSF3-8 TaxID=3241598 RepID=UPI003531B339